MSDGTVLSYVALRSLKYSYVGKENADLDQKHCFFPCNLRICDLWTRTPRKFVDVAVVEVEGLQYVQIFNDLETVHSHRP